MQLERLEIAGFKSFRDRVILKFSPGITAIVGPNGCGKSNVVDALRWVMGEQKIRYLRGKKLEDIIFYGSEEASLVGLAEVTMVLSRSEGEVFPDPYGSSEEVSISRYHFRDGESEYFLNKIPCRLLDIREFFMGTGVGSRTIWDYRAERHPTTDRLQTGRTPSLHRRGRRNYQIQGS